MPKGQVSVGDDTPTGEPENGPRGPYITDKDDGTQKPEPRKKERHTREDSDQRREPDNKLPSRTETKITERSELGSDR